MITTKRTKLLQALSLFLLSGLLWCCADEHVNNIPTTGGGEENAITFSVKVPSVSTPKTRALNESDENEVSHIAVLLFDSDGNFTYQPIYCEGSNITTDPDNSQLKSFTINPPIGTYDMVLLSNSNQSLNSVLGSINEGQPKAVVLNKLLLSNSGKWNATPGSSDYKHIPMWGEVKDVVVSGSTSTKKPVKLIRMVAKIDVALITPEAKEKFNLQSVRLYNYNDQGQIVPDESKWNNDESVVTAPSVPSSASKLSTPLVYDGAAITSDDDSRGISIVDEIYTFETIAGISSDLLTNTCIVVGGVYDGDSQATYYRIDFANTTSLGVSYAPLLRNYNYKVNISNVKGSGFNSPDEAFRTRPVNIEASIINWSDAEITDVVFDGQYMLGVSEGTFTFSREKRDASDDHNTLSVTTDFPTGWKIDKIVDESGNIINWLDATIKNGSSGATTKTKLLLTENDSGDIRTGFIHLSAGRLVYIVKVNQLATAMSLSITDINGNPIRMLEFVAGSDVQPEQQQFTLNWSPALLSLTYINITEGNAFSFANGADLDNISGSGTVSNPLGANTYTIRPPAITASELSGNPFYERTSTVIYSFINDRSSVAKTLTLRQSVYNAVPKVNDFYLMDGTTQHFSVRSNTPFTVSVKDNPDSVISLITTYGESNTTEMGTPIYFDIIDDLTNPTLLQRDVILTIKSPTGLFADRDITLNCEIGTLQPKSNSYIVKPNALSIMIPVSRANESMLGNQLSTGIAFTAELIWTDNPNKIAANSNIKAIGFTGSGPTGYLVVKPGLAEGNAVVAIKNMSGKILWSWHIWVTDFTPTPFGAGKFMDRNLGAIGNTPGSFDTHGLMYQWGRKDPFPSSLDVGFAGYGTEPTLYTATGTSTIAKTSVPENTNNNFANSVANPFTFYHSGSDNDWYFKDGGGSRNDDLWSTSKTVYDPCPEGWRIPERNVWNAFNNDSFPYYEDFFGRISPTHGGFYPAAGSRRQKDGTFYYVGSQGSYWSVTPTTSEWIAAFYFFKTGMYFIDGYRASGYSVRCVKE